MAKSTFNTTVSLNTVPPDEFMEKLDTLEPLVPEFVQLTKEENSALVRLASVDPAFMQDAISAIGVSDSLRSAVGRSPQELQQEGELIARWDVAASRVESILKGVRFGLVVRRHRLGLMAAQTYQLARALARQQEHANLIPYVNKLASRNKLGKRRAAKSAVPPVPVPPATS